MWRTERYKKKDGGRGGKLRWSRWAMGGCQSKQCQTQTCSHSLPLSFLEIDVWLVTGGQTSWVLAEVKRHSFNHYWVASESTLFLNVKQKSISILLCPDYTVGQGHQNHSLLNGFCLYCSYQRHTRTQQQELISNKQHTYNYSFLKNVIT